MKELLKEIEELLSKYDGKMEIDPYILNYLSKEELQKIKQNLLKKQENVIKDNSEWLEQFKRYKLSPFVNTNL